MFDVGSDRWARASLAALAALLAACGGGGGAPDPGLEGLDIVDVQPRSVVPGSTLVVDGRSFAGEPWGTPHLRLEGRFVDGDAERPVEALLPARFVDLDRLEVEVDAAFLATLGGERGTFVGHVAVAIDSALDGERHESPALAVELAVQPTLSPELEQLRDDGLLFVNDWIEVEGDGFLLGGGEGETVAVIEGCFALEGRESCEPVAPIAVPIEPRAPFDRTRGRFAFAPGIAGIRSGRFAGSVALENRHAGGDALVSGGAEVSYDLTEAAVFTIDPPSASLGQYVSVLGGGFLGGGDGSTLLEMVGTYLPRGGHRPVDVDLVLVPEFAEGREVRYLVTEDDALGEILDLRSGTGTFSGELRPITRHGVVEIVGDATPVTLTFAPVKQVVHLRFTHTYVAALRHFGLRAVDAEIRQRVIEVVERDFATINLEVRTEAPEDFALYAEVEVGGADPNGLGLLGYDNTPGKDVGNQRLHDRIGGVNASTQLDGYPGYGGVFIESLFVFSEHPGAFGARSSAADPLFDDLFDPFRPDRGGAPVRAADLQGGVPALARGDDCPATERRDRLACAIFALGNLIGTTISHEIGHSLGLANPEGSGSHHVDDAPDRLMDAGSLRPFVERAEIGGAGPGRFCDGAYDYLRVILPTDEPASDVARPACR